MPRDCGLKCGPVDVFPPTLTLAFLNRKWLELKVSEAIHWMSASVAIVSSTQLIFCPTAADRILTHRSGDIRAGTHKIEVSEIIIFMHHIHLSMHKLMYRKKIKTIDHNTVYMDPKVQNHGKWEGMDSGTLVGRPF